MDDVFRNFCQSVIDNIKKNGFPEKKVAFPLESMYEAADKKGVNFNKVLETLHGIEIEHQKTPEKIIFYPRPKTAAPDVSKTAGMDFSKMDMGTMMTAAAEMMKNISPEQLEAAKQLYENMSEDERAAVIRQAREMGFFPGDEEER